MTDADTSLNHLVRVLAERDIGLGHDDLAWLYEAPDTRDGMLAWVSEYLNPETMLTREELELYANICHVNGPPFPQPNTIQPRPLSEPDFETAIRALESSTAEIERQCAVMQAQKSALEHLLQDRTTEGVPLPGPNVGAKARLEAEIDEDAEALRGCLVGAQGDADASAAALRESAQRQLDADDRLLDGLQKILTNAAPVADHEPQMAELEKLCQALVALQSKTVKDRTNAVYKAALAQVTALPEQEAPATSEGSDQDAEAITDELESLLSEVSSVLEMAVHNQYRKPAMQRLKESQVHAQRQQQQWLGYVSQTLQSLTIRCTLLAAQLQDSHAYSTSLATVSSALTTITDTPSSAPQTTRLAPLKLNATALLSLTKDPALELLRYHSIPLPSSGLSIPSFTSALDAAMRARETRTRAVAAATENAVFGLVGEAVDGVDGQLEGLLGAVFAFSGGRRVELVDAGVARAIEGLDRVVGEVAERVGRVDGAALAREEGRRVREALGV